MTVRESSHRALFLSFFLFWQGEAVLSLAAVHITENARL